jgi:DNA-binding transcriptional LysR family regulator
VRLELLLTDDQSAHHLEQGGIDLLIAPEGYTARELPAEHLLDERHVVVGWKDNPLLAGSLDEAAFMGADHVQVAIGYQRTPAFGDRELGLQGRQLRVAARASSFAVVPWLLVQTERLALMHERLALVMAALHPLAIREIPFDFPVMREMMQCHPARAADPGLAWLRERLHRQTVIHKSK